MSGRVSSKAQPECSICERKLSTLDDVIWSKRDRDYCDPCFKGEQSGDEPRTGSAPTLPRDVLSRAIGLARAAVVFAKDGTELSAVAIELRDILTEEFEPCTSADPMRVAMQAVLAAATGDEDAEDEPDEEEMLEALMKIHDIASAALATPCASNEEETK